VRGFLAKFVALSIVSGTTIGINKILMTYFGLSLQASNWQLGAISAAETFGLAVGTLPAGVLVSRGNPRALYGQASAVLAVCFLVIPRLGVWFVLPPLMAFVGFCIAFRIVSMNAIFLGELRALGHGWAGWYRGTLSLGTMAIGPWFGNLFTRAVGTKPSFAISAGLFAVMATLGVLALPRKRANVVQSQTRKGNWLVPLWQDRVVRQACLMEGLSGYCASFFGTFMLVILIRDHGWARERAIHILLLNGCVYVSVLLGAGWVLTKVTRAVLDRLVYGAAVVAMVGLGLADRPAFFVVWTGLFSLALGFNNLINIAAVASSRCDRGHVSGVTTLMQMFGGCLGSFLGGVLSCLFHLQHLFVLFSLPWLAAVLIRTRRREPSPVNGLPVAGEVARE
jgi:MFS transporter, ACDE family, multidrug resistance protein